MSLRTGGYGYAKNALITTGLAEDCFVRSVYAALAQTFGPTPGRMSRALPEKRPKNALWADGG